MAKLLDNIGIILYVFCSLIIFPVILLFNCLIGTIQLYRFVRFYMQKWHLLKPAKKRHIPAIPATIRLHVFGH